MNVLAIVLAALAAPAPHVHMTAEPRVAGLGDTVALAVHNPTDHEVTYGLLDTTIERRVRGHWLSATSEVYGGYGIPALALLVHPHETRRSSLDRAYLPPTIATGRYRFTRTVDVRGRRLPLTVHAKLRVRR